MGCSAAHRSGGRTAQSACRLGRRPWGGYFNVLGNPIDGKGEIGGQEYYPIHRPAPSFAEQTTRVEVFETGLKVIDLIATFTKGGKTGIFGGAGVGKNNHHSGIDPLDRYRAQRKVGICRGR